MKEYALRSMAFAGLVAMAGCATTPGTTTLDGTSWRLTAWSASSQRADAFPITARFEDGGVSGRSAVNTYRGPVTYGADGTLAIGAIATTRMAGPEPAMRAEHLYLELLGQAGRYRVEGSTLTLLDANGNERLVYAATDD
jgi:heat shock protein HslJ